MALELTRLPKTQFSGLEYENILEDITRLVVDNPNYNTNWDDFLSSNAGRMLVELFSYIADQLSTRIDWMVNEAYIGTATQKKSVMRILKLIGYNFTLPIASNVDVTLTLDRPVGTFYLSEPYSANEGELDLYSLTAVDKSGKTRNFEAIEYDSVNARYEYKTGIEIPSGTSSLPNLTHVVDFYEGTSVIDTFTVETDNNQIITLTQSLVIENSVRVYQVEISGGLTTETELLKVQSFLDPEAQQDKDSFGNDYALPYLLNVEEDDTVTVEFGPTSLLADPSRRPRVDDQIRIFYRVGGGIDGNITSRSINTTKRFIANSETVNITFINNFEGVGGRDGETPEYASVYAPLQIRTAQKAVTEEDYNILLSSDNTVLKAKSYGNNNMPANLYSLYGEFIKPLEVWNFVLKDQPGWENIAPSVYNDFQWVTLRLENRFNELHSFREGSFNERYDISETQIETVDLNLDWNDSGTTETFRNYIEVVTTDNFKSIYPANSDLLAKLTSDTTDEEYFTSLTAENFFDEQLATNDGLIEGDTPTYQISQDIHARYLSHTDIANNIDLTTRKYISLAFDGRDSIEDIDLTSEITELTFGSGGTNNTNYDGFYVTLFADTTEHYFWWNTGASGDPAPGGSGHEVSITTGNTSAEIADATLTAINLVTGLDATYYDYDTVIRVKTISSLNPSAITDASTNSTALTVDIIADASDTGTPHEIANRINTEYAFDSNYNDGAAMIQKGYQEFGLSISDTDIVGLDLMAYYYFRVNGIEYSFYSGETLNEPTYSQMVDLMKEAISFTVEGIFTNGDTKITGVNKGDYINRIKKGMEVTGDSIPASTYINEVNILEDWFTITNPVTASDTNQELTIYPYDITLEGTAPTQDIRITNMRENPYEYVRVENGQNTNSSLNLFTKLVTEGVLVNDYPEAFTVSSGVFGNTYLGINGVINATSGYQAYDGTGISVSSSTTYSFTLTVDGTLHPADIDISLTIGDDESDIAAAIESELTSLALGASCAINEDGQVRITSDSTGATSTIAIGSASTGNQLWAEFGASLLDATDDPIDGEDDALSGLTAATNYQITINSFTYTLTTSGTTFLSLASDLDTLLDSHGYTATVTGTEWDEDILITSDTPSGVCIKDIDLLSSITGIIRVESNAKTTNDWEALGAIQGGGDYSHVAYIIDEATETGTNQYIYLESPSKGVFNSQVRFEGGAVADTERVLFQLFGIDVDPTDLAPANRKVCYGYRRLTLVTRSDADQVGNYIFEVGGINLKTTSMSTYNNYLYSDQDTIEIGTYYTDNFDTDDAAYRDYGKRIYNTVYNDSNEIDIENSKFFVKLTRTESDKMSIFAIDNDWTISEAEAATITSLQDPETLVGPSDYEINISVDGRGFVEIDVTGDNGVSATYDIDQLINNINAAIKTDSAYSSDDTYSSYNYARKNDDGDRIILKSPSNTNDSSIEFNPPAGIVDATNALFGLSELPSGSYSHIFYATGDYYISYDKTALAGDLTLNSDWVTDVSSTDLDGLYVGKKILRITGVLNECYVINIDTDNSRFQISDVASSTQNDITLYSSRDIMLLNRITSGNNISRLPDLDFYLHFVYDKRYVEGVFDGSSENNVQTEGYPLGSLDEDIYDESLSGAKIVGLNHVFKETKFTVFDIKGTVYFNKVFSSADVQSRVEDSLQEEFGLVNRDYAEPIARSKIMAVIHENNGVEYVEIEYLGTDATDETTNVTNTIDAEFDEIIVLSEDRFLAGNKIHGILFTYKASGT